MVKIIVKAGKRYVKVGRKLVKISDKISERELIQWLVKHLKPKRRKRKGEPKEPKISTAPMTANVVQSDRDRIEMRDVKDKLEEKQRELNLLKLAAANQQSIISAGRQKQIESKEEEERHYPESQVREAMDAATKKFNELQDEIKKLETDIGSSKQELTDTKQSLADTNQSLDVTKQSLADAESKRIEADDARRVGQIKDLQREIDELQKAKVREEADRIKGQYKDKNSLMKLAATHALNQKQNPSEAYLLKLIIGANQNLLGENKITKEVNSKFDPQINYRLDVIHALSDQMGFGKKKTAKKVSTDDGTSEDQLNAAMKSYPEYLGTIAVDEIHLLEKRVGSRQKFCWIMNTEPRSQGGAHWVCFYVDLPREVDYYDPLADPISVLRGDVMKDVKALIKGVHGEKTYLRFKENGVPDQSDTSNNCGEFCVHFLQSRLKGESFGKASGWNDLGEEKIEKWKLQPKQKIWLSGQAGEGLRDITIPPRKGATRIFDRIKATLDLFAKLQKIK